MVGKTNVAGIRLRSVIAVSYPAGSVCTCSNGTKTLKAKDTGGQALFNVSIGTWTVSCTDGSRTKSTQVSITAEGQNVSVVLEYEFYIFKSGAGLQNGFKVTKVNGCSNYNPSDKTKITMSGSDHNVISFSPSVNLSKYSTIVFDIQNIESNQYGILCGVSSNSTSWNATDPYAGFDSWVRLLDSTSRKTLKLNIASISTAKYIKIHEILNSGYVYNVYLE